MKGHLELWHHNGEADVEEAADQVIGAWYAP